LSSSEGWATTGALTDVVVRLASGAGSSRPSLEEQATPRTATASAASREAGWP
jgi:hypothetical protein